MKDGFLPVAAVTPEVRVADVDFNTGSLTIPVGMTAQFTGTFTIRRSTIEDSTGYSAVLTYAASEPATVSVASEQGPFVTHFYVGTQSTIAAMRDAIASSPV